MPSQFQTPYLIFKCPQCIRHVWRDFFFTFPIQPQKKMAIFVFMRYRLLIELHQRTRRLIVLLTDVTSFTTTNACRTLPTQAIIQNSHSMNCVNWRSMVSYYNSDIYGFGFVFFFCFFKSKQL